MILKCIHTLLIHLLIEGIRKDAILSTNNLMKECYVVSVVVLWLGEGVFIHLMSYNYLANKKCFQLGLTKLNQEFRTICIFIDISRGINGLSLIGINYINYFACIFLITNKILKYE